MWNGLWIYRWSWIPHACKTIGTNRAPGFCLQVVAVAAISLPHPLQPPRLLLWLSRQWEAGEEGGEALAREEREERGVEEGVTVFQRSQRFRAGVEVKAALHMIREQFGYETGDQIHLVKLSLLSQVLCNQLLSWKLTRAKFCAWNVSWFFQQMVFG